MVHSFVKYQVYKYLPDTGQTTIRSQSQIILGIYRYLSFCGSQQVCLMTHTVKKLHLYALSPRNKLQFLRLKMRLPQVRYLNFNSDILCNAPKMLSPIIIE